MTDLMARGEPEVLTLDFEPETAPNEVYVRLHHALIHKRTGKQVARRKIGNNTYAERCVNQFGHPAIAVRLHNTRVVIHTAYTMQFFTGGWTTVTTKDRINSWSGNGIRVQSERGTWTVVLGNRTPDHVGEHKHAFAEGMVLHWTPTGWSTDAPDFVEAPATAHNDTVRAQVKRWLDLMPPTLCGSFGSMEHQRFAIDDCVSCVTSDRWATRNVGDEFENQEHLFSHIVSGEYPMNLITLGCNELSTQLPNLFFLAESEQSRQAHATVRRALRYAMLTRLLTGVVVVSKR